MCKLPYQPLTVLVRVEPSDSPWVSTSARALGAAATFAAIIALSGAVAICSNGFRAFLPGTFGPKGSAGVPVFPETKVSPVALADQDNGVSILPPNTNQGRREAIRSEHSTFDQTPSVALAATPPPALTVQPESTASVSSSALFDQEHPEAVRRILEKPLSKPVRKSLENERRRAARALRGRAVRDRSYSRHRT
jgi:hypothetical protein